jgi:phospholipase C
MRALLALALVLVLAAAPLHAETPPPCPFGPGDHPAATLPPGTPLGADIPIDHVLVLMQENRSFDHYFGRLPHTGQRHADGLPRGASNPDPTGGPAIGTFHQTRTCEADGLDLAHGWNAVHRQYNGGAMDGFTETNVEPEDPTGGRAMGYYTRTELPFYYRLARTFAIGDRYFSSVLGPTYPNRYFLLAATSFGHISNEFPTGANDWSQPTIFNLLDDAGVSWKIYNNDLPFGFLFAYVRAHPANVVPIAQYFTDAAAGTLPQVTFIDPRFLGTPNQESDEHPPANVQVGQAFVADVVRALIASPLWLRSALFLTYDEHGGYYDHVPPPLACVPDDIPPAVRPNDAQAAFDRYGIRVPLVVVSPWARRHFVSHVVHDHTSILRFIETRFDLPALTRRDANADPMLELFDFRRPHRRQRLAASPIDAEKAAECGDSAGGAFF